MQFGLLPNMTSLQNANKGKIAYFDIKSVYPVGVIISLPVSTHPSLFCVFVCAEAREEQRG